MSEGIPRQEETSETSSKTPKQKKWVRGTQEGENENEHRHKRTDDVIRTTEDTTNGKSH